VSDTTLAADVAWDFPWGKYHLAATLGTDYEVILNLHSILLPPL
jgi:hypothetical protein